MKKEKLMLEAIKQDLLKIVNFQLSNKAEWRFSYIIPITILAVMAGVYFKNIFVGLLVFSVATYHIVRYRSLFCQRVPKQKSTSNDMHLQKLDTFGGAYQWGAFLFYIASMLLSYVQKSYNNRAENNVGKKLKHEVKSYEEDDQIASHRHTLACGSCFYRVHKEHEATEYKDCRVSNRADDCRNQNGYVTIDLFKKLVGNACQQARQDTLDHNGNNGTRDTETQPERRVCRHEEHHACYCAKPCTREGAAQSCTENHGDEGQRDRGKTADLDKSTHVGENCHECSQKRE